MMRNNITKSIREYMWANGFIDIETPFLGKSTPEGARDYLKIMSYIGTAHKQGYNAYEAIKNAISGNPDFIFG